MKKMCSFFFAISCLLLTATLYAKTEATKITKVPRALEWLDLIPQKERNQFTDNGMPIVNHNGEAAKQSHVGATRPELNKQYVKIPGFVIPLEGDDKKITEFLLVPYFGACIHVPPPPPNQIIYVKFPNGAPIQELWDVIYIVGTLKTESNHSDIAEAGYTIEGDKIEAYDDIEQNAG